MFMDRGRKREGDGGVDERMLVNGCRMLRSEGRERRGEAVDGRQASGGRGR